MEIIDQMNREKVLYKFYVLKSSSLFYFSGLLTFPGVFWGGIRYTLHVFFVRRVIKYHKISSSVL